MSKKVPVVHIVVTGFADCPYYKQAIADAKEYSAKNPESLTWEKVELPYNEWPAARVRFLEKLGKSGDSHTTCPLVFTATKGPVPKDFIGGADSLRNFLKTEYTP